MLGNLDGDSLANILSFCTHLKLEYEKLQIVNKTLYTVMTGRESPLQRDIDALKDIVTPMNESLRRVRESLHIPRIVVQMFVDEDCKEMIFKDIKQVFWRRMRPLSDMEFEILLQLPDSGASQEH